MKYFQWNLVLKLKFAWSFNETSDKLKLFRWSFNKTSTRNSLYFEENSRYFEQKSLHFEENGLESAPKNSLF